MPICAGVDGGRTQTDRLHHSANFGHARPRVKFARSPAPEPRKTDVRHRSRGFAPRTAKPLASLKLPYPINEFFAALRATHRPMVPVLVHVAALLISTATAPMPGFREFHRRLQSGFATASRTSTAAIRSVRFTSNCAIRSPATNVRSGSGRRARGIIPSRPRPQWPRSSRRFLALRFGRYVVRIEPRMQAGRLARVVPHNLSQIAS